MVKMNIIFSILMDNFFLSMKKCAKLIFMTHIHDIIRYLCTNERYECKIFFRVYPIKNITISFTKAKKSCKSFSPPYNDHCFIY